YAGLTEAVGRFAGRNPERFPEVEQVFDVAYKGYTQSVDFLEDYGMWIWPDTHNNWSLGYRKPQNHRLWTQGHYQGVWEAIFLYLRSGTPMHYVWSRDNYEHFANVSTVNYHDPLHPLQGHLAG